MPSTDTKPELTAKASMAQPISQPAVYASGLINVLIMLATVLKNKVMYRQLIHSVAFVN
jgi:hypothetical protein